MLEFYTIDQGSGPKPGQESGRERSRRTVSWHHRRLEMDPQLYSDFFEIEDHYWWSVGTRNFFLNMLDAALPGGRGRVLDL